MSALNSVLHCSSTLQISTEFAEKPALLYGVLEGMMDGILVVTTQGQIKYANQSAQEVFQLLSTQPIPPQIWKTCVALIESQELFSPQNFILEDEIHTQQIQGLRVRVRSIECGVSETCLLVAIENRDRNNQSAAFVEAQRYGLTNRETEVWMLRRTNLSYKAIAAKLHIAIDTVKKHIKSIRAKQQIVMWND